ncbi:MAG TPA: hypothetical protein VN025_13505 [Candidatus Dormibacteraeota bacterium]|jgi:hypothetical protein|nr:hypothetical protein [Candidatus Dormibacteraeota bacterium]
MKTIDKGRKWMWGFLGAAVLLQTYFAWELIAAFALFAVLFAVIATAVVGLYVAQKGWELAVARVAASNHPAVHIARRSVNSVEVLARRGVVAAGELARRPLQRPSSNNPLSKAA